MGKRQAGRQAGKKNDEYGVFWMFSDGVWIPFVLQGKPLTSVQLASWLPLFVFVIIITSKP
jgi:membrane-bound metal-dependent hydrolase YbcI (DUF457 family)